jgi:hypothetical protein
MFFAKSVSECRKRKARPRLPWFSPSVERLEDRRLLSVSPFAHYDMGTPTVTDIWGDAALGNDANGGTSRSDALRTASVAWDHIPSGVALGTAGYRILLAPGTYREDAMPTWWDDRHGTYEHPIIIAWTANHVGAGSKISLCYDRDTTLWNGNEIWIEVDQVVAANGAGTYNWNTAGVPAGTYYIAGYLFENGTPYLSHLNQSITITRNTVGPTIGGVVITQATGPQNPVLLTTDDLLMTFNASDPDGVRSATVQVDGGNVQPIYGPYTGTTGGSDFAATMGTRTAGTHTYSIVATDNATAFSRNTRSQGLWPERQDRQW